MTDDRYERSADMRLLELQREALGKAPRVIGSTRYTDVDPNGEQLDDDPGLQHGSILVATIDAQPRSGLIAGALITVSLSIGNDGDEPAGSVRLCLPLPADTVYRPGTFAIDGLIQEDAQANDLFGSGVDLGTVEPGSRRTVVVKSVVEAGMRDVIFVPHLSAASAAVLGLRAIRLTRSTVITAQVVTERPFYESDDEEQTSAGYEPPAPQSTITVLQPREFPPPLEPLTADRQPEASFGKPPPVVSAIRRIDNEASEAGTVERRIPAPAQISGEPSSEAPVEKAAREASALVAQPPTPPTADLPAATPLKPGPTPDLPATVQTIAADLPKALSRKVVTPSDLALSGKAAKTKSKPEAKPRAKPKAKTIREPAPAPAPAPAKESIDRAPHQAPILVPRVLEGAPIVNVPVRGLGGPILTVKLDRKRLATLSRFFSGPSLGMIAHYLMLNALAATDALPGDGIDVSIATFVTTQEKLLSRALITTRLGKPPIANDLSAPLPPFPPSVAAHDGTVTVPAPSADGEALLIRAFATSEIDFIGRMLTDTKSPAFLQAAQLFVGLCANGAVISDGYLARRARQALTAYAALATAEISRIFLRSRISGQPELFKPTDPTFDDAARTVLDTLADLFA